MLRQKVAAYAACFFIFTGSVYADSPVSEAVSLQEVQSQDDTVDAAAPVMETDVRDSIMKVMTVYEFTDGSYDVWVQGYGTLIAKDCILIPKNLATIERDSQLYRDIIAAKPEGSTVSRMDAYQMQGIDLRDYNTAMKGVHTYVLEGAQKVEATVSTAAGGDSFSLLIPLERINSKPPAILGEGSLKTGDIVYAIGTDKAETTSRTDFFGRYSTITGTRKSQTSAYVEFEGTFRDLCAGCPLVDVNQNVVGLITDGTAGRGSAVDIRTVGSVLDAANIEYTTANHQPDDVSADLLVSRLNEAEGLDPSQYTEESYQQLLSVVETAKQIASESNASRNRINKAIESLEKAMGQLQVVDHSQKYKQMAIIAGMVLILLSAVIIVLRMLLQNRGKERWQIEEEKEEKKRLKQEARENKKRKKAAKANRDDQESRDAAMMGGRAEYDLREDETGVLRNALADEGETGVLRQKEPVLMMRCPDDGRLITVNKDIFVIGRSAEGTDYRIAGDVNVSRKHCQIARSLDRFYLSDLESGNGTFVDGSPVVPGNEVELRPGQDVMIADVHFIVETIG